MVGYYYAICTLCINKLFWMKIIRMQVLYFEEILKTFKSHYKFNKRKIKSWKHSYITIYIKYLKQQMVITVAAYHISLANVYVEWNVSVSSEAKNTNPIIFTTIWSCLCILFFCIIHKLKMFIYKDLKTPSVIRIL